ncbi:MAG: D-alanine--D-alanine ligase family protein [Erysipelotrichaceae bacterium]
MKLKVGVIFGGESVEHEISIISAQQAIKALDADKYDIIPIYLSKDCQFYYGDYLSEISNFSDLNNVIAQSQQVTLVKKANQVVVEAVTNSLFKKRELTTIDVAIPIVHGTNVEDGTIQACMEILKVPYTSSSVMASAVAQDKVFMKQVFAANKVPQVEWMWFYANQFLEDKKSILQEFSKKIGLPAIIKPANLGSSVGTKIAKTEAELISAIELAISFDQKVIIEKLIENLLEVNCSVLGNHNNFRLSELEEITNENNFLDFDSKYRGGGKSKGMASASRVIPARISEKEREKIYELAKRAFLAVDASGVVRIDFMKDLDTNKYYVTEINNIPGSLSFYLWEPLGVSYTSLLDEMITIAIDNYRLKEKLTFSYQTNILDSYQKGFKSGTKVKV